MSVRRWLIWLKRGHKEVIRTCRLAACMRVATFYRARRQGTGTTFKIEREAAALCPRHR